MSRYSYNYLSPMSHNVSVVTDVASPL